MYDALFGRDRQMSLRGQRLKQQHVARANFIANRNRASARQTVRRPFSEPVRAQRVVSGCLHLYSGPC